MSDNPNKRGRQDRQTVSRQPHELGHVISKVTKAHSDMPREQVMKAIFAARDKIAPSEGRTKLMQEIEKRLK